MSLALGCGEQKLTAFNAEPKVTITSPSKDDRVVGEGMPVRLVASVDDADDPEEELIATWTVGDRQVCAELAVSEMGLTSCVARLGEFEGSVTVVVQDPGGSTGAASILLKVEPTDEPNVTIVRPTETARYYDGLAFEVLASVSDSEDHPKDLTVAWTLQDAEVGGDPEAIELASTPDDDGDVGGDLSLVEGIYNLGVRVTDTTDKTTSDSVQFRVSGPNRSPTCAWVAPADGTVLVSDTPITLEGLAGDPDWEGEANRLTVTWTSDRDDVLGESTPASSGEVQLTEADLSASAHTLTLEVADETGATCAVDRSVVVTARPEVTLSRPRGEVLYYVDHPVQLEGIITDPPDVDSLTAEWSSDADGALDVSPDLDATGKTEGSVMLSEGPHTLTLVGTDAFDVTGMDTSTIVVRGPNQVPTCAIVSPESGSGGSEAVITTFTGLVDDADIGPEALSVSWASDIDGPFGESTPGSDGDVTISTGALTLGTHTLTLTAIDEVGAVCTDNIVFIVGRPPVVSISSPIDGSVSNAGSVVTFLGSATDPDEEESLLYVEWSSDRDGLIFSGAPDSAGITLTTSAELTVGDHTITLTATDSLGLTATAAAVFRVNGLPTTPVIHIAPDPAYTTDVLSVVVDAESVDFELDPVTYRYEWFRGGDLVSASGTVSSELTTKHESWMVRVTPSDGYGEGIGATATVVIQNTLPIALSVSIGPDDVYTNTVAEAVVVVSDEDDDEVSLVHEWTVNGAPSGDASGVLDGVAWFDKHDVIELLVTPADGDGVGSPVVSSAVVVQNSPPSAPSIRIMPDEPIGSFDPLICDIEEPGIDLDGDPVLYTLSWERDGESYPGVAPEDTGGGWLGPLTDEWTGDTVPAIDTHPGEEWQCSVTSWDDEAEGGTATASVVLSEPPPGCGDGILHAGEEVDPPPGPFLNVSVDAETCRWDFSDVEQLYCYGFCSWAGPPGCDDEDADVLCKLITDNPDSEALTYTITAPLSEPGFPGVYCGFGVLIDTDRGVPDVSWMDESMAAYHGGGGEVVAFPDCTDP